eukprot:COSAG02_NODE_461_length_21848_cov_235.681043_8_plen_59_part_00
MYVLVLARSLARVVTIRCGSARARQLAALQHAQHAHGGPRARAVVDIMAASRSSRGRG